ncbi:MAG: signal recognition particle receptor subunit alpha, partial [Planctomycetes bacterium]|nr:signal recognition particle receptor subunit alpha [Planctomycetota bacterium]
MRSILLPLLLIAGPASIAGCRAPATDISPSTDEVRPPNGPPAIEPAENIDYAELARNVPIVAGGRFAHPAPTQEQLEELLISADVGVGPTQHLLGRLKERVSEESISQPEAALAVLKEEMVATLRVDGSGRGLEAKGSPFVVLVAGV